VNVLWTFYGQLGRNGVASMSKKWCFTHTTADTKSWNEGLRKIFDYRDLGINAATGGDYVAHIIRCNGNKDPDDVQQWHIHECDFQYVQVLAGTAKFEYEGHGIHILKQGDVVLQPPSIKHREIEVSEDFEVLEIVSPADFTTHVVDPPSGEL